ncbi:sensor histidine kinase [Bifidobacterium margollesii]|nr:ATP-binding protein [Bifidobacterium margollesii]
MDYETIRLLSLVPSISVVVDEDGEVLRTGPAAYRLGVVADDRIVDEQIARAVDDVLRDGGKRSLEVVTQTCPQYVDPMVDAVEARERGDESWQGGGDSLSRPNWLEVTVGKLSKTMAVVLINDVSEERRFAQVRDDFVANVTEQLLKPTRELEILGRHLEDDEVDIDRIMIGASLVHGYAEHLGRLVSDLLLLIKAQGRIVPDDDNRIDLLEQVNAAVAEMRDEARDAHVRLVVKGGEGLTVNGDADQLKGAFVKLVQNAIEYSPQNSSVGIAVGTAKDGKYAMVRVIDQGCGIAKEQQSRIFERFYRGDNQTSRTRDGVGLGLAIVKHVALTHHGSVSVWSAPRKGSTFTFVLPLAKPGQ